MQNIVSSVVLLIQDLLTVMKYQNILIVRSSLSDEEGHWIKTPFLILMAAMLLSLTKEVNTNAFVKVHQYGGYDAK